MHTEYIFPKISVKRCVIVCAAPLSSINLPSMEPKVNIRIIFPMVPPIPVSTESNIPIICMPFNKPTHTEVINNEKKASNLK